MAQRGVYPGDRQGIDARLPPVQKDGEPVAWYGPIVMNTKAEIEQAVAQLRDGTFLRQE